MSEPTKKAGIAHACRRGGVLLRKIVTIFRGHGLARSSLFWGIPAMLFSNARDSRFVPPLALMAVSLLGSLAVPAHAVSIEWVTVGDPGNAADTTGYGAVAEEFRIGKYEVTIGQYAEFLNSVASTDPYSLYNPNMGSDANIVGITRSGSSGSYSYVVTGPSGITPVGASSPGNRPITWVSWFDAARFANWIENGQGSASTETGAYTLVGGQTTGTPPARNPGAVVYIPTEDQWYKSAYYKGSGTNTGYWDYATQSDSLPDNEIGSGVNQANYRENSTNSFSVTQSVVYSSIQNYLTDVGAFTSSASAYNTFDQNGNVWEWNDLAGTAGATRGVRGGGWDYDNEVGLSSSFRLSYNPSYENVSLGFRIVPEPSTWVMGLAGIACGGYSLFRRRRAR
jgi:formylglycine-generating enzyme required for sulfatase activity